MGRGWKRPDLPEGALKALNDELHELHGLSGHRTTREIERWLKRKHGDEAPSHTKIHQVFTRPSLPKPEIVLRIVRVLAQRIHSVNAEDECDRFDALWRAAYEEQMDQQGRRSEQRGSLQSAGDDLSTIAPPQSQDERAYVSWQIVSRPALADQIDNRDLALPDSRTSRAVIAGVDSRLFGPARAGAKDLCDLLRKPSGPFLGENIAAAIDPTKDQLHEQLQEAADSAKDTLLFYYAGRSRVSRVGFQLDVSDTKYNSGHFADYGTIREIVFGCRALRKVVILDCTSHAGQVLERVGHPKLGMGPLADSSVYVIAATGISGVPVGDSRYLPFTGALIEILCNGVHLGPEMLTVDFLINKIQQQARALDFPEPQSSIRNDRGLALARNPAYREGLPIIDI